MRSWNGDSQHLPLCRYIVTHQSGVSRAAQKLCPTLTKATYNSILLATKPTQCPDIHPKFRFPYTPLGRIPLPAEGRHSIMATDPDATAPSPTREVNITLSLTSSSTVARIHGLNSLNDRIKREGACVLLAERETWLLTVDTRVASGTGWIGLALTVCEPPILYRPAIAQSGPQMPSSLL